MNYTKGKWYWEYNDQQHHNLRAKSTHPSGCEEDKHILFVAPDFLGEDSLINDADAQLIAKAPRMYELLERLLNTSFNPNGENFDILLPFLDEANEIYRELNHC